MKRVETITYVISAGLAGVAGVCYAAYIGQMSQQVGIAYELYAIAAAVLGGCSLRGGEGTVLGIIIGSAVMRVIDNGINMFQIRTSTLTASGASGVSTRTGRSSSSGAVILVAVILDQIVASVPGRRRSPACLRGSRRGGAEPPGGRGLQRSGVAGRTIARSRKRLSPPARTGSGGSEPPRTRNRRGRRSSSTNHVQTRRIFTGRRGGGEEEKKNLSLAVSRSPPPASL